MLSCQPYSLPPAIYLSPGKGTLENHENAAQISQRNWRVFMAVSVRRFHLLLLCPGKGVAVAAVVGGGKMQLCLLYVCCFKSSMSHTVLFIKLGVRRSNLSQPSSASAHSRWSPQLGLQCLVQRFSSEATTRRTSPPFIILPFLSRPRHTIRRP